MSDSLLAPTRFAHYRYCLGPYRKHRGHSERSSEFWADSWPRRFRYGAMKEAFDWHETAMRFESGMIGPRTGWKGNQRAKRSDKNVRQVECGSGTVQWKIGRAS